MIACSDPPANSPPPQTPADLAAPAVAPEPVAPAEAPTSIHVSRELVEICDLPQDEAYFGYDSSRVRADEQGVLKKLAECFKTGPMAGKNMKLVGHADPRGEDSYNLALGERRAASVRDVLLDFGVGDRQMSTTSRGEFDASGSDEASWAKDRRVDIMSG
jgi:peptidoglycan-associated lipoprotein